MRPFVVILILLVVSNGCITAPYRYGAADRYYVSQKLAAVTGPQVERGQPRPIIDGVGWVIGIPGKIILWDWRIDNHHISTETEEALSGYLAANELATVKVRLNQYAPLEEWRRLTANDSVGWGWRYTFGTISWLGYTIFPGRIWGGDHFNSYTNTINVYSDAPAIVLHEGGHAKDFAGRKWKGTYAAIYVLPAVPLWHEAIATNDALSYVHETIPGSAEYEAHRLLYPAYATYLSDALSPLVPRHGGLLFAGAVIPAHLIGRMRGADLEREHADLESSLAPPTEIETMLERLPPIEPEFATPGG